MTSEQYLIVGVIVWLLATAVGAWLAKDKSDIGIAVLIGAAIGGTWPLSLMAVAVVFVGLCLIELIAKIKGIAE